MPLGFCCGGFSSTAGYVPGNEAHSLSRLSDFCLPLWLFLSKKRFSFLSEKPQKSCDFFQAKPFGFDARRK
jgi:hypothetical protein